MTKILFSLMDTFFLPSWFLFMATFFSISVIHNLLIPVAEALVLVSVISTHRPLALVASFLIFTYILTYTLSFSFNKRQFYCLSDVLAYICNYPKKQDYVNLYVNVVCQTIQIFDMSELFTLGLIKAIK